MLYGQAMGHYAAAGTPDIGSPLIETTDLAAWDDKTAATFVLQKQSMAIWTAPLDGPKDPDRPVQWSKVDTVRWRSEAMFRVLPSTKHWYFLAADGKLWQTPRQGEADREVKEIWAAGDKKILGTIIDHDLARSFVFGDGWYLDLGDEITTVTEPADKPWPRPAADAPEIERLRVWRGWVDLTNPPPPAR